MSKKLKKLLKKLRKIGKAQDKDPGASSEGRSTMSSDTAQAGGYRDPRDGTAVIPPVTAAMMDHAAREAAALADGVAHHAIAPHGPAGEASGATPPDRNGAQDAAAAPDPAPAEAAAAAVVREAEGPAGDAAVGTPSDALSLYNAKVMEVMRANAASATAFFAALVQAKSVPEALSLNADHLRRQMDTLTSQGHELAALAQRVALDALQPFKGRPED